MAFKPIFPFSAIVGQEAMKLALILNAINPRLGGVLIRGEKGTAKSRTVRALAALLPHIQVIQGCRFRCDPDRMETFCPDCRERLAAGENLTRAEEKMRVVELPVNATEDRVVGSLDLEQAIQKGKKRFEPGLLAEANRALLYADEVNLLEDHIMDVLLDAAAMGINTVEREGIGFSHPSEFILVGTMNPEEGELRPQLLDRFGLCVNITGITDREQRIEIMRNWESYEQDPQGTAARFRGREEALSERISQAAALLPLVYIEQDLLDRIARISLELEIHGHRADLTMMTASKTLAAFQGEKKVRWEHIDQILEISLNHRMRRHPFDEMRFDPSRIKEVLGALAEPPKQSGR
jgi:magnesium chelatase subunit I